MENDNKKTIEDIEKTLNNDLEPPKEEEKITINSEVKDDNQEQEKRKKELFASIFGKKKDKTKRNKEDKTNANKILTKKSYIIIIGVVSIAVAIYTGIVFEHYMSKSSIKKPIVKSIVLRPKAKKIEKVIANATNITNATQNATNATNMVSTKNIMKTANAIYSLKNNKKMFDIFSLEPSQDYKLDQIKNTYSKILDILKIQKNILKTKQQMQKIISGSSETTSKKTSENKIPVMAPPPSKLPSLPTVNNSQKNIVPFPTNSMPTIGMPPSPINTGMSGGNILSKVSVNLIYNFKGKKIAVVQYDNSIFRAGVGDNVAPGYKITDIKDDGIYVTGPDGEAFLPLAFKNTTTHGIIFSVNPHSKVNQINGNQQLGNIPNGNFAPPVVFNPSNMPNQAVGLGGSK